MKHLIFLVIAILLVGCNNSGKPSKPDNLISEDKMSDILYDVFLLNAAKGINKRILENNGIMPQEYVYKKYGIDSLQFAKSNDYYAYDTKTYEGIISKVKQKIEAEKKLVDDIILQKEKSKDSLNDLKNKSIKPDFKRKIKS